MAKKKAKRQPAKVQVAEEADELNEKRPRDEHYAAIREKNREFRDAYIEWASYKDQAAEAKKRHERIGKELTELISRGPNPQLELPFGSYDWQSRSIAELGLSDHQIQLLESGGITTIGELSLFWASGKYLDQINGIAGETSSIIADAYADYARDHPEVYGDEE